MKTQREIMEQRDQNKQYLLDQIEKYSGERINKEIIAWLNMCKGAYKAICMVEHGWDKTDSEHAAESRGKDHYIPTPELDGDTEFERLIMKIPMDAEHIPGVFKIFNTHMIQLENANPKAYNRIIEGLKRVAEN